MDGTQPEWRPQTIRRFIKSFPTGASVALVKTDQGPGYIKALGAGGGPHLLACEWVGTHLARRLGLPTFDCAIIEVTDLDEIPFHIGGTAKPGPAFITRKERGTTLGKGGRELHQVVNPDDINRLVLFDNWTLNCDRHPPDLNNRKPNRDNVFLSAEEVPRGKYRLKAMDHTHCFTCGRDLNRSVAFIDRIQESRVYGRFPEFEPFLDKVKMKEAIRDLRAVQREEVEAIVESVPEAWQVVAAVRKALVELITQRARYVSDHLFHLIWPQRELDFMNSEDEP